jgi:aryl-alcohol dehydrogenase-like predicted oxidoreductase
MVSQEPPWLEHYDVPRASARPIRRRSLFADLMRTRALGVTDLRLPVICFGAFAIGGGPWGKQDEDEAVRAMQLAIDLGMNAFDTAPVYGLGRSEELVGRALKGRRERALVLTKVGLRWDDPRPGPSRMIPGPDGRLVSIRRNARPDSVRLEVDASLRRLDVERIDLVQVHAPDPETPIAETMGALADLRREGKLREIGVSNYDVEGIEAARRALGSVPLASDQPAYNLIDRRIEKDILRYATEHRIGILAHTPLEQGLLTGKIGTDRTFSEGEARLRRRSFQPAIRERVNAQLDEVVRPIARAHAATIAQVVLAWTAAQSGITSLLVGARSVDQVRENAGAAELELTSAEIETIGASFVQLRLDSFGGRLRSKLASVLRRLRKS